LLLERDIALIVLLTLLALNYDFLVASAVGNDCKQSSGRSSVEVRELK
jgi:hypothetical protein